jgi:hypothetical protein
MRLGIEGGKIRDSRLIFAFARNRFGKFDQLNLLQPAALRGERVTGVFIGDYQQLFRGIGGEIGRTKLPVAPAGAVGPGAGDCGYRLGAGGSHGDGVGICDGDGPFVAEIFGHEHALPQEHQAHAKHNDYYRFSIHEIDLADAAEVTKAAGLELGKNWVGAGPGRARNHPTGDTGKSGVRPDNFRKLHHAFGRLPPHTPNTSA